MALTITLPSGAEIPNYKTRTFSFLLYPDTNPRHAKALEALQTSYQFLGILHDKDEMEVNDETGATAPKPNHWHCVVKFRTQRYLSAVAAELDIEPNLFRDCKNFEGYARYMLHLDDPDKHQYEFKDMVGSLKDLAEKACIGQETVDEQFLRCMELLDSFGCEVSMRQFATACAKAGLYAVCRGSGYLMAQIIKEHNREVRFEFERQFDHDRVQ